MHRCGSGFLLTLAITFVVALTGCLGKSSSNANNGGVSSVTLSPGNITSVDVGGTLNFSATAKSATGGTILGVDIHFIVGVPQGASGPAPLSMSSGGSACAGTWDPTGTICNPGTSGIATVQAVTNGVFSPTTTVYVHQHIDSMTIADAQTPPPQHLCFSQGETRQYQATAYSNNVDITTSVGPMTWSSSNTGVLTTATTVPGLVPPLQNNQVQVTAKAPGITQLFANVSGTNSSPFPFTTCLIQAIYLEVGGQGQSGNSVTVNNGGTVPITATVVDALCGVASNSPVATPPLTWSTTVPEVAGFGTATNTTGTNNATARSNLGGATVTASCSPPSCNIGVVPALPVYASEYDSTNPPSTCRPSNLTKAFGAISINVTSTSKTPTYTAWATTTDCGNRPGCSAALFSVTPSTTSPIGANILSLPRTPNSMMFNHLASGRIYFGSDQGLMFVDFTASGLSVSEVSQATTPCNVSLCGKVLTISNDGTQVVVADTVSTPSQVYIYNGSSTTTAPIDLVLSTPGEIATAAAFSPDQSKLFILTDKGNMYVYSTVDALRTVVLSNPATQAAFSADGSFAYVAGTPDASSVSAYSTCSLPLPGPASTRIGFVSASATPLEIFPSPVVQADFQSLTQDIIALERSTVGTPHVTAEVLTAQFKQLPIPYQTPLQLTCNPPTLLSFSQGRSFNLGEGDFEPVYTQLVADGTELIIVARKIPAVLVLNVSNGTTSAVALTGSADPLSASASTDGSQVYVAACDQYAADGTTCTAGSVHIVNTCGVISCNVPPDIGVGDFQDVPYVNINNNNNTNMCNNQGPNAPVCFPNLIAIKPQ